MTITDEMIQEARAKVEGKEYRTEMTSDRTYRCMRAPNPLAAFESEVEFEAKRNDQAWLTRLMTDVCEVIRETVPPLVPSNLHVALCDVAAVAIAWAEALEHEQEAEHNETDMVE